MLNKIVLLFLCLTWTYYLQAQKSFPPPVLGEDSITVTGHYKNFKWKQGDVFTMSAYALTTGQEQRFSTPIDSTGKFRLRFPMQLAGTLYMDWGRLFEITAGIPGETFHIEADMNDYPDPTEIAVARDMVRLRQYFMRNRNITITGKNARIHNEVMRFQWSLTGLMKFDQEWKENITSDVMYRDSVVAQYNREMSLLQSYDKTNKLHPMSRQFLEAGIQYHNVLDLTQYQYTLEKFNQQTFSEDYMNTLRKLTVLDDSYGYLSRDYLIYLRDMKSYITRLVTKQSNGMQTVNSADVDSVMNIYFRSSLMKQLVTTWDVRSMLERNPEPLNPGQLKDFEFRVTDPVLRKSVYQENAKLAVVSADTSSLGDTKLVTTMPDVETTEEVYNYLVNQYKGSVIYIDIWGTWCGPCREQMQYVPDMKELLKDKNVVFVYLASSSPEIAWKNMIKYYKLTGHNVVHYNLPPKQQQLFEKEYLNRGWPTYILIDKEGKMVTKDAPRPQDAAGVVEAIGKLL